jgi:hypothetical protein
MMQTLNISPQFVLLPILVYGAWLGLRRGWKDEAWTLGALLLTLFVVARPETVLLPILERVIAAFQRAAQALLGRDTGGEPFRFDATARPWAALLAFLIFVSLAYAVGHFLGKGEKNKGLWRILAALLGGLNVALVVSWLVTGFLATRDEDGTLRLTIPSFDGATVNVGTPTTTSLLASWPGLLGMLIVAIILIFILTRVMSSAKGGSGAK